MQMHAAIMFQQASHSLHGQHKDAVYLWLELVRICKGLCVLALHIPSSNRSQFIWCATWCKMMLILYISWCCMYSPCDVWVEPNKSTIPEWRDHASIYAGHVPSAAATSPVQSTMQCAGADTCFISEETP